ncbi:hypothetical protein INT45_011835 [Circinella minor]|uniref:Uncharacterized protein n=1 Tax=Circinella minor TaxID=1195481 RepID=A0A8H7VII9_9FUNG|nr:hypothetical protein INT45_011835 [Circinella minor]
MLPTLVLLKRIPALTKIQLDPLFSKRTSLSTSCDAFNAKAFLAKPPLPTSKSYTVTVITGKKSISKQSVIRYRATRRLKAVIADSFPCHAPKGYHYIFYSNSPIVTLPWTTLQTQMIRVLDTLRKKIDKESKKSPSMTSLPIYPSSSSRSGKKKYIKASIPPSPLQKK